jgi:hypothetical protein
VRRPSGGAGHWSRFPVAFRLPAFASRVILSPVGDWAFLAVGLPGCARTHRDSTFRTHELQPGRGASLPRGQRCPHGRSRVSGRPPAASQRQRPYTPVEHPPSEAQLDEASSRVHCIHLSGLPLACGPRMERAPLGFSPELRTPPLPATHVRMGTGLEHWPGTTQSTSWVDPPSYESTRIVRPRVAPRESCLLSLLMGQSSDRSLADDPQYWMASVESFPGCRFELNRYPRPR